MALVACVIVENIINKIDKIYDYIVPQNLIIKAQIGKRVVIPFSRNNTRKHALILSLTQKNETENLKEIISIIDEKPVVTAEQIKMISFIKENYFSTYYDAFKSMLPRGIGQKIKKYLTLSDNILDEKYKDVVNFFKSSKGKVTFDKIPPELLNKVKLAIKDEIVFENYESVKNLGQLSEKFLSLNIPIEEVEKYLSELSPRFEGQRDLLTLFFDSNIYSAKEALYLSGATVSSLKTLVNKGILKVINEPKRRDPYKNLIKKENQTKINLSNSQKTAFDSILSNYFDKANVTLLYGITGSGKTSIYLKLIDEVINNNKSALFLVPEISLTPQMLQIFYQRYGKKVFVIHSGLSAGQRADEYRNILESESCVVVGTRSAVLCPIKNIGIIIMDEEHESSYKAENNPKYHARTLAKFRCLENNCLLLIGSATPSINSMYNAKIGKYNLVTLEERFNKNPLPNVEIIDMKDEFRSGNNSFLSETLKQKLESNLKEGGQSILFLNRRGTHTLIGCRSCGYVAKCPNCEIALTYHSKNNRLMCHYCGYSIKMFDKCPECENENIKMLGVGTQLVENELKEIIPDAKILRMDMDTVVSHVSYSNMLNDFADKKYDILLGTQMVAKGLDFENVTLVGVLNADMSLYIEDYRANERTFSLLTQVCGRSGRAKKTGVAYIQTYSPENEVIEYAKNQDYKGFYDFEIDFRKAINYPPFCDIVNLTTSSISRQDAINSIKMLYEEIDRLSKNEFSDIPIRLLNPQIPRIEFSKNHFRRSLLIKCKNSKRLRNMINTAINNININKSTNIMININPTSNI